MAAKFRPASGHTMTPTELGWVAGLLEGEGSFMMLGRHGGTTRALRVSMQSTDLDVLERLREITGVGRVCKIGPREDRKPCWQWASQRRNDCVRLMEQVYDLMSARRQAQIDDALATVAGVQLQIGATA